EKPDEAANEPSLAAEHKLADSDNSSHRLPSRLARELNPSLRVADTASEANRKKAAVWRSVAMLSVSAAAATFLIAGSVIFTTQSTKVQKDEERLGILEGGYERLATNISDLSSQLRQDGEQLKSTESKYDDAIARLSDLSSQLRRQEKRLRESMALLERNPNPK